MSSDKNKQDKQGDSEKRKGSDRRKFAFGYNGPERRDGERRSKKDSD
ncbi:MAG: hypothetical protein WC496_07495 [Phycisphaerae bacterium]|jgi:hypothetical protein